MNLKLRYLLVLLLGLFCLINECHGRKKIRRRSQRNVETKESNRQDNITSLKYSKTKKSKHVGSTKLRHIATRKVNNPGSQLRTHLPLTAKGKEQMKRQFILRPPSQQFNPFLGQKPPFLMMKPPPLTQKTVVTTHIPRPPIAIPFNPFLMNHIMHSFHGGMHNPFGFMGNGDFMKGYNDDDDSEDDSGMYD